MFTKEIAVRLQSLFYLQDKSKLKEGKRMDDFQVMNHCLMIRLPREIDHHLAGWLCDEADKYLLYQDVYHVVFDFEDTRFMDSSGIGIIVGRYKKVSGLGGKVYILHADRYIRKLLELSGIGKIVEMVEDKDEK